MPFPLRTSLVCIFFLPMDEAGIKKDFCSASGEQYRHANTEPGVALHSESASGSWWCCACASRQETRYSRKCFAVQICVGVPNGVHSCLVLPLFISLQWPFTSWSMS